MHLHAPRAQGRNGFDHALVTHVCRCLLNTFVTEVSFQCLPGFQRGSELDERRLIPSRCVLCKVDQLLLATQGPGTPICLLQRAVWGPQGAMAFWRPGRWYLLTHALPWDGKLPISEQGKNFKVR